MVISIHSCIKSVIHSPNRHLLSTYYGLGTELGPEITKVLNRLVSTSIQGAQNQMREGQVISIWSATLEQCAGCSGGTGSVFLMQPQDGMVFGSAFWKRQSELGLIRESYLCEHWKGRTAEDILDWEFSTHRGCQIRARVLCICSPALVS